MLANRIENLVSEYRAQQAIEQERDQKTARFENAIDPIIEVELERETSTITDVNPAFERTFGFDRDEIVGRTVKELLVPEGGWEAHERFTRLSRQGETVETTAERNVTAGTHEFLLRIIPVDVNGEANRAYAWYVDLSDFRSDSVEPGRTIRTEQSSL